MLLPQLRREDVAVDGVVDDAKLVFGDPEPIADLVADHLGVANDRAQRRTRVELPFHFQNVTVVGTPFDHAARERGLVAQALLEAHLVHAVPRPIDVATEEPFVRQHQLRRRPGDLAGDRPREDTPIVPRLQNEGAIIIGKTTTSEFGWTGVSRSPLTGITSNPWKPGYNAGASSLKRSAPA